MAASPVPTYTYNLLGGDVSPASLVASVISANPTATALVINCAPGTDSNDCGYYNASMTFGPWAALTPPPNAPSTGVFDLAYTVAAEDVVTGSATINKADKAAATATETGTGTVVAPESSFTLSMHCELTSTTVMRACTTTNNGPDNNGKPTATESAASNAKDFALAPLTVAITAGADKLATLTSSPSGSSSSSSSGGSGGSTSTATSTTTSTSTSGTGTHGSATHGSAGSSSTSAASSGTSSGTSAAASPSHTGSSAATNGVSLRSVGLLGLFAVAFLVR